MKDHEGPGASLNKERLKELGLLNLEERRLRAGMSPIRTGCHKYVQIFQGRV